MSNSVLLPNALSELVKVVFVKVVTSADVEVELSVVVPVVVDDAVWVPLIEAVAPLLNVCEVPPDSV